MTETLLKESEKSKITLLEDENGVRLVRKELAGHHEVYDRLQNISHPYLPKIFSVVQEEDCTVVTEEYIPGGSIGQAGLTAAQVIRAITELCSVLTFLHSKQILHRDIKPSNILMGDDGHIRLIDFDAARTVKPEAESDTRHLGTRGFAPPEQYGFAQTDARTDIYAVGVTLKVLLGEHATKSKYQRVIARCTAIDPKRRYSQANQIPKALRGSGRKRSYTMVALLLATVAACAFWFLREIPQEQKLPVSLGSRLPAVQIEPQEDVSATPTESENTENAAEWETKKAASDYIGKTVNDIYDEFGDAAVLGSGYWNGARYVSLTDRTPSISFCFLQDYEVTGDEIITAIDSSTDSFDILPGVGYSLTQSELVAEVAKLPYAEFSSGMENDSEFNRTVLFYVYDFQVLVFYEDAGEFPFSVLVKRWYSNNSCDKFMTQYADQEGLGEFFRENVPDINNGLVSYRFNEYNVQLDVDRGTGEIMKYYL